MNAAIYCRLSTATMGDTTNVDEQAEIGRKIAKARGWRVRPEHVYKDNSRSAWQRNRKRPGWDAMLEAIETGDVNGIVVYHGDRLIRQPSDLEILLILAKEKGIKLASPAGGERNLDNPEDQYILRIEAAHACKSSDDTSRRVKRYLERRRNEGLVNTGGGGGRPFAFRTDGRRHMRREADALRTVVRMLLEGATLAGAERWCAARKITGTGGEPLNATTLRTIITNPRYAGLLPDGKTRAGWKPVLDREDWEAVCSLFKARKRRGPHAQHLLSGIILCGSCGWPLSIKADDGARSYRCVAGKNRPPCPRRVSRAADLTDAYVSGRVVALLSSPAFLAATERPADNSLAAEIAKLEQLRNRRQREFETLIADPEFSPQLAHHAMTALTRRIGELRKRAAATGRQRLITAHAKITREAWETLPLDTRRSLIAACFKISVMPAPHGRYPFDPSLIKMERRGVAD